MKELMKELPSALDRIHTLRSDTLEAMYRAVNAGYKIVIIPPGDIKGDVVAAPSFGLGVIEEAIIDSVAAKLKSGAEAYKVQRDLKG